jgi:hypothetical protein
MDDRPINKIDKITDKLHNKYIGVEPMLLIAVIALIIIYYYVFSSLGNNEDGSASSIKVFAETTLWFIFIILLLLNGVSYIFGIDLIQTLNASFIDDYQDVVEPEQENIDVHMNVRFKKQVFNLPENKYTYDDAKAVCKAYGARLATYEDMSKAYDKGADWCSYGWSADQMALFPTQKEKWDKLQKIKGHEKDCGRPGINGGYIYEPTMNYGVNCFGLKPRIDKDEADRMRNIPIINKTADELKFDNRVNYWKNKLSDIEMAPFNHDNWSML